MKREIERSVREQEALLQAARKVAADAGLPTVLLWEEPGAGTSAAAGLGGERRLREGTLPMLHPLAAGASAAGWQRLPRGLWV